MRVLAAGEERPRQSQRTKRRACFLEDYDTSTPASASSSR